MHSFTLAAALTALAPLSAAQETIQIDLNSSQEAANAAGSRVSISADGRFFAFQSDATNLVASDSNGVTDVFLRDRAFGVTKRISVATGGVQVFGASQSPSVSAGGRYVAFVSAASTLVGNDSNGFGDVFLHDTQGAVTTRISVTAGGTQGNNLSAEPDVSADGRYVVFSTYASNLVTDVSAGCDIVLCDRNSGALTRVSASTLGQEPNEQSFAPRISDDGRYVVFHSYASNLVAGDFNGHPDVFCFDVGAGTLSALTMDPNSIIGNGASQEAEISAQGDFVVFASQANNLIANDTNLAWDVFRWKRSNGAFHRASVGNAGVEGNATSTMGSISSDGVRVAFRSYAYNLVAGDTNSVADVFVRDMAAGTTARVNLDSQGLQALQHSDTPAISADGAAVAFVSLAQLAATDTNAVSDVYAFADRCTGASTYCTAKTNSAGCVPSICSAGMPDLSGPDNFNLTAFRVLNQKSGMFFWGNSPIVAPLGGGTRCVGYPVTRTAVINSGGNTTSSDCSGVYAFFMSHAYMASHGLTAGTQVFGQFWSRDPFFPQPNNIGLTDGVEFTVVP